MQPYVSIVDASRITNLAVSTIRRYVSHRKIPFTRLGARVVFSQERLRTWLEERSVEPQQERDEQ